VPARDVAARLDDMLAAIADARRFVEGHTPESFAADAMVRRAVERMVEIISEASRHLPPEMKARHPEVPWRAVAGIGNILRHTYERVEDREIWLVVTRDLDPLQAAIEAMRAGLPG
jgi:uncharacterized protein with HEPN domain